MADAIPQSFPKIESSFLDAQGHVSREWRYLLQALWNRTGGGSGIFGNGQFTDEHGSNGAAGFLAGFDFIGGTTTRLTLSQNYGSAANLFITFDGTWQGADQYSLSGKTLTFTTPIPAGITKVFVKGFVATNS